jgi:hypothetical protein
MAATQQYNLRMDPADLELLNVVAKRDGRRVSDIIRWASRLYGMALLTKQSSYLKRESRDIMEQRIGKDCAEELLVRVAADVEMFKEFIESLTPVSNYSESNANTPTETIANTHT